MSRPKILIATGVYPPGIGGSATCAHMLMEGLPEHGFEPVLAAFDRCLHLPSGLRHLAFLRRIIAIARNADLYLALDPVSVGLPTLAASRLLSKPLALRVGGDFAWEQAVQRHGVCDDLDRFLEKRYGWRVELLRTIEHRVARSSGLVIVPSRYLAGVALRWGVGADRVRVVTNAAPPAAAGSREQARASLGIAGRWVVSVGRLLRLKGFAGVIDAVAGLRSSFPDLRLAIVGSGPEHAALEARIQQGGLRDAVRLAGALPHSATLRMIQAADVFVLNSACEGMPHVVLEAMAAGTPVVATRVGGIPEVIEHGVNGRLVAPGDTAGLRSAIREALDHPGSAAALSARARQARDRSSQREMVRQTAMALRAVM